jgi:hypothetical protein
MRLQGQGQSIAAVLLLLAVVSLSASASAEVTPDEQKLIKRIPAGYNLYSTGGAGNMIARGDLNGDGAEDYALIIEKSDDEDVFPRIRGIMIFFSDGGDYKLALENRRLFEPHPGWDHDVSFFEPSSFHIAKGNLYINYPEMFNCNSANYKYTIRYRNSEFELIGYDYVYTSCGRYEEAGETTTSINFPAGKKLVRDCPHGKKCKDTWSSISLREPLLLRKLIGIDMEDIEDKGYILKPSAK